MENNKLIIGGIGTVFVIVITTLLLSTGSSRCLTEPFWQETNIDGIFYCAEDDTYRACTTLSSTNKTCYHITNATQINQSFEDYSLEWTLIEDDPNINSSILIAELNDDGVVELDLVIDGEHKVWHSNNKTGDITVTENATGNVSLQFSILSETFYLHVGNASDIYEFIVTESLSSNDVKDVKILDLTTEDNEINGINGKYLDNSFRDTNYMNVSNSNSLTYFEDFTVEAWIRPTGTLDYWTGFVSKWGSSNGQRSFILGHSGADDRFIFGLSNNGNYNANYLALHDTDEEIGQWYHLVGVYDKSESLAKFYVNNRNVDNFSMDTGIHASNLDLWFGTYTGSNLAYADIDEVRIYNRSLSNSEINQSYNDGLSGIDSTVSSDKLQGYWDMENGDDGSGNNNDAVNPDEVYYVDGSYLSWYNDSTKSWWQEGNDTVVDNSLIFDNLANERGAYLWKDGDFPRDDGAIMTWVYVYDFSPDGIVDIFSRGNIDWTSPTTYDGGIRWGLVVKENEIGSSGFLGPATINLNKWYYVGFSWNSTGRYAYYNKSIVGSDTGSFPTGDYDWFIGKNPFSIRTNSGRAKFKLDEYVIYNKSQSLQNFITNYNRGLEKKDINLTDNLIGYYDFEQLNCGTTDGCYTDKSGNGNDLIGTSKLEITGRSSKTNFPTKSYLISNNNGLDILDAENESNAKLWMRFTKNNNGISDANMLYGTGDTVPMKAVFKNGVLNVITGNDVTSFGAYDRIDFIRDRGVIVSDFTTNVDYYYDGDISTRNDELGFTSDGDFELIGNSYNAVDYTMINDTLYWVVGSNEGVSVVIDKGYIASEHSTGEVYSVLADNSNIYYSNNTHLIKKSNIQDLTYSENPEGTFTQDNLISISNIQAITSNNNYVFVGTKYGVKLINKTTFTDTNNDINTSNSLPYYSNAISGLDTSDDGNYLYISTREGRLYEFDIDNNNLTTNFTASNFSIIEDNYTFSQNLIETLALPRMALDAGDIDGDGYEDLLVADQSLDDLILYLNDQDNTFTKQILDASYDMSLTSFGIGDLDDDGDRDITVSGDGEDVFSWFLNDGNESFTRNDLAVADARGADLGDIDGDGDLDAVVGRFVDDANNVYWYENNGTAGFTQHNLATISGRIEPPRMGDMDGDGDLDVMVPSYDNGAYFCDNNGSATFSCSLVDNTYTPVLNIDIADIDSDGDLDFSISNAASLVWYENNGSASFTTHLIETRSSTRKHDSGDFDKNGYVDFAVSDYNGNKFVLVLNYGNENYTNKTIQIGDRPYLSKFFDVDADGDLDFAGGYEGKSSVDWSENEDEINSLDVSIPITLSDSSTEREILLGTQFDGSRLWYEDITAVDSITVTLSLNSTILEKDVDSVLAECTATSEGVTISNYIFNVTYPNGTLLYEDLTANTSVTLTPSNLTETGTYTTNCYAANNSISDSDTQTFEVYTQPTVNTISIDSRGADFLEVSCDSTNGTPYTIQNYTIELVGQETQTGLSSCYYFFRGLSDSTSYTINITAYDDGGYSGNNFTTASTYSLEGNESTAKTPADDLDFKWARQLLKVFKGYFRNIYWQDSDGNTEVRAYLNNDDLYFTNNNSGNYIFDNEINASKFNGEINEEPNLNVNSSDYWDTTDTFNTTQMSNNGGILTILESWLNGIYCQLIGCTMAGDINMNNNNIYNVINLTVEDKTTTRELFVGNSTGNATWEKDGFLTLEGDARGYDDLRFPSNIIKVQGASNTPEFKQFRNTTYELAFDPITMEQGFLTMQFPHTRASNTTIQPHFHWSPEDTDTGYVTWCLDYTCANVGDNMPFITNRCINDTASGTAFDHQMTDMIHITNTLEESAICSIRLYRDAPADNYTGDAYLLEFDVHYTINRPQGERNH